MNNQTRHTIFLTLMALNLAVIWSVSPFPTADGPGHLHMVHMWLNYETTPLFQHFYDQHPLISGYRFIYWILFPLVQIFSYETAEQILLSLYVIAFPLSGYYALKPFTKHAHILCFLFFPLTFNFAFMIGLFNTSFATIFLLLGFGVWGRVRDHISVRNAWPLGLIALILFATHVFGLFQLYFWIGCFFIYDMIIRKKPFWDMFKQEWLPVFWVFLPSILLSLSFFTNMEEYHFLFSNKLSFFERIILYSVDLFALQPLSLATKLEHMINVGLGFCMLFLAAYKFHKSPNDLAKRFVFMFGFYAAIYIFTPFEKVGLPLLADRVLLFSTFAFIFVITSFDYKKTYLNTIFGISVALTVFFAGMRIHQGLDFEQRTHDYLAIEDHIDTNSTLLTIHYWDELKDDYKRLRTIPLQHLASRVGYRKNIVNLSLWPPPQGYLPVGYKHDVNPYFYITHDKNLSMLIGGIAPLINVDGYEKKANHKIDYIAVMGTPPENWEYGGWHGDAAQKLKNQLAEKYKLVFITPHKTVKLYKRR